MRYYVIDDLTDEDLQTLSASLKSLSLGSGVDNLFWLPIPHEHLSQIQIEHAQTCGQYVMSLELQPGCLRLELLVRARGRLRCECVHYADKALQTYIIAWLDKYLADLLIVT